MNRPTLFVLTLVAALLLTLLVPSPAGAAPEGQLTWAVHVSLAPAWFDPAESTGIITPFMFLYAMHDALVKSMPGNPLAPSLPRPRQRRGRQRSGTMKSWRSSGAAPWASSTRPASSAWAASWPSR